MNSGSGIVWFGHCRVPALQPGSGKGEGLKHWIARIIAEWSNVLLPALLKMGFWGAGAAAMLDSSTIPIPMDLVLAGYIWGDKGHFWLYCLMGAVGSSIGGLLPYGLGRAGGELFLLKRINRQRFEQMRSRFERQEFLAMMIPSMMPPPWPWKVFVFAAGVFEMRVALFMVSVFCGRMLRWLILSALVLKLGPGAVDIVAHHAARAAIGLAALLLIAGLWWWLKRRRQKPAVS
jgi:membrane protein YqaA with SNARE-associated domain